METASDVLALTGVHFGYGGGMNRRKGYGFSLRTTQGKVYFSASDREADWSFSGVEVPAVVMEELGEIARAGGAVGTPQWVDPLITKRALDAATHTYDLSWADRSKTGPGTAAGLIVKYLRNLARKCRDELPEEELKESGGVLVGFTGFGVENYKPDPAPEADHSDALMLTIVNFGRGGGMDMRDTYSYVLITIDGKVYFSAGDRKAGWGFSNVEVLAVVMEDLSKIARDGGAVGTPVWEDPMRTMMMLDAATSNYDLYWDDGSHTGPGTASGTMMKYIYALAKKCLAELPEEEHEQQKDGESYNNMGFMGFAGLGLVGAMGPSWAKNNFYETKTPAYEVKTPAEDTREKWTCTNCDYPGNLARFCMECGAPKPA